MKKNKFPVITGKTGQFAGKAVFASFTCCGFGSSEIPAQGRNDAFRIGVVVFDSTNTPSLFGKGESIFSTSYFICTAAYLFKLSHKHISTLTH